jgi:hypothetical protein
VDTGWDSSVGQIARHELQQSHLGRGILHGDSVRLELEVGIAADVSAIVCVCEEGFFRRLEM